MLPGKTSFSGFTILGLASRAGYTKILSCLLAEGADPNVRGDLDLTALHGAVYSNESSLPSMALLIAERAEIDALDDSGNSPLMIACLHTNLNASALLLSHGANLGLTNADGRNAHDLLLGSYNSALEDKRMYRHQITDAKFLFEMIEAFEAKHAQA